MPKPFPDNPPNHAYGYTPPGEEETPTVAEPEPAVDESDTQADVGETPTEEIPPGSAENRGLGITKQKLPPDTPKDVDTGPEKPRPEGDGAARGAST